MHCHSGKSTTRLSVNKFLWKPPEPPELVLVVFGRSMRFWWFWVPVFGKVLVVLSRFGEVLVVLGSGGFETLGITLVDYPEL